jgi:hypothetical protein
VITLSPHSVSALQLVITGNGEMSKYRSGPMLIDFFGEFGPREQYGQGFPSRWYYAEEKLREHNGTEKMEAIILAAVDRRAFLETNFDPEAVVDHLNQFLELDGYQIVPDGKRWRRLPLIAGIR